MKQKLQLWCAIFITLVTLDIATTLIAITSNVGVEANPLMIDLFDKVGLYKALFLVGVIQIVWFIYATHLFIRWKRHEVVMLGILIVASTLRLVVVLNNLAVIFGVRIGG